MSVIFGDVSSTNSKPSISIDVDQAVLVAVDSRIAMSRHCCAEQDMQAKVHADSFFLFLFFSFRSRVQL